MNETTLLFSLDTKFILPARSLVLNSCLVFLVLLLNAYKLGFLLCGRSRFPVALDRAHTPGSDKLVLPIGPLRNITQMSEENYVVMKTGLSTFLKNEGLYFQRDWKPLFNVSPLVTEMCQKPCPLFWRCHCVSAGM